MVNNRVACHDVLSGDARMFEAFSFQDITAGSSEISTHLHLRLVRDQLVTYARKEMSVLSCSRTSLVKLRVSCEYLSSARRETS